MALVCDQQRFIIPEAYFGCSHGHLPILKLQSGTVSAQVENWSKIDTNTKVTEYMPNENKLKLSNGKEYTYKALVFAPGFDHKVDYVKGLSEFEKDKGENKTFAHLINDSMRVDRNYYHGWNHVSGDFINYSPKFPYKGEGTDFYALYYEHFLR